MTVDELREMLAEQPGHWHVFVQVPDAAETGGPSPVVDVYAWQEATSWTRPGHTTPVRHTTPVVVVSS